MKKLIAFLVLSIMFLPTAFASELVLSNDGSVLVDKGHTTVASCLWYLPNYRHLLADWKSNVNEVIAAEIDRILQAK